MEFTDKKEVFYSKVAGTFDTPKKLNRSSENVPSAFIEKIEAGEASSADIKELQKTLPIFTYQSCLTIHGNLPQIGRTRIGGYKNVIQNKNGSLEIRWSAIDYQAKKEIRNYLRFADMWNAQENSTNGIYFEKSERVNSIHEARELLAKRRAEAEKMNISGLTAKIFVTGWAYFGLYYIVLTVLPYSVTEKPILIASQLSEVSEAELLAKQAESEEKTQQREQAAKQAQELRAQQLATAEAQLSNLKKCNISANVGSVYVVPIVTTSGKPAFRFYQIAGKGTFGRVIVGTYISTEPTPQSEKFEPYMKGKQVKLQEITTKQVYLIS